MTSPREGLSRMEIIVAGVMIAAGLVISAVARPYDSANMMMAISLTVVSVLASSVLFLVGLKALGVPPGPRTAGALWASVPWNTLLLSQIAYVGFFLLPIEIAIAALILRYRAHVSRLWASLSVTTVVRIATLALVYAVAPVFRSLFSWH